MFFWVKYAVQKVRRKRGAGFGVVLTAILVALLGNALCFYYFEGRADPDITFLDAIWYSIISISTIGYGDYYAKTLGGRIGLMVFIMGLGLGAFSALIGLLVDRMMQINYKELNGLSTIHSKDHILLVNFPDAGRVEQIIAELRRDAEYKKRDVVIVTDVLETLPFQQPDIFFVNGSPLQADVLIRAGLGRAKMAMILADPSNPHSDGVVAAIINLIEHLHPEVKTVAECLDPRHSVLFRATKCDSIVYTHTVLNNLLVNEVQDAGITGVIAHLTANDSETGLYSCTVMESGGPSYMETAKSSLDRSRRLLSVTRNGEHHIDLKGMSPQQGDLVVYIGTSRLSWKDLN